MVDWEQPVRCFEKVLDERKHLRPRWERFVDLGGKQVMKDIGPPLTPRVVMNIIGGDDAQEADIASLAFNPLDSAP